MKRAALGSLAAGLTLVGCASVPEFPEPDRSWLTKSGQLQYITPGNRVIGEVEVSRRDGDFRLQFTKGGAVPLIRVSRHERYARAEGALARGRWQGVADQAPSALRGWVNDVPRGFSDAKISQRMEIQGAQAGERFIFVFDR
jgi:hypothetical protein